MHYSGFVYSTYVRSISYVLPLHDFCNSFVLRQHRIFIKRAMLHVFQGDNPIYPQWKIEFKFQDILCFFVHAPSRETETATAPSFHKWQNKGKKAETDRLSN